MLYLFYSVGRGNSENKFFFFSVVGPRSFILYWQALQSIVKKGTVVLSLLFILLTLKHTGLPGLDGR